MIPASTLAAKPVNDTILLRINFDLLPNRAYVFNEMQLTLFDLDTASDWDTVAQLFFENHGRAMAGVRLRMPIQMVLMGNNGVDKQILGSRVLAGELPRTPIVASDSSNVLNFNISLQNTAAAVAAAAVVSFFISFFEFDLDQVQFFPVNVSPSVSTR